MPRGLDVTIAFISSTALIFNLSTYILPISINRAFANTITVTPNYEGSPTFDFAFNGKCFADDVRVSCFDSMLESIRASSTGYDDIDSLQVEPGYYQLMKLLVASYSICKCSVPFSPSLLIGSPWLDAFIMLLFARVRSG